MKPGASWPLPQTYTDMERASRTRLLTALVLAAVFGTGVLVGLVADSNLGAQPTDVVGPVADASDEEAPRRTRIYEQVEPNEMQLALIDSIVAEHRSRTNALDEANRFALNAGFRVILLETREAIKGVFTPDQAARYQTLLNERDARVEAERENRDNRD